MTCANHPDRERSGFCQSCGKPLCTDCVRNVGNSTFCEPCLTARVHGPAQPGGYPFPGPPAGPAVPPPAPGEPSPGLAALLGFIPGVGAMYNGQYAKGVVHLIVFAILVSLADEHDIFGLFVAGWIVYMAIEAYHTAQARRDGTPLPNPFGLNDISERFGFGKAWPGSAPGAPFGATPSSDSAAASAAGQDPQVPPANPAPPPYGYGYAPPTAQWAAPSDAYSYGVPPVPPIPPVPPVPPYPDPNLSYLRRLPTGALWLIGLGLLFLVGNTGLFHLVPGRLFGPLILIGLGVWSFVHRMTSTGQSLENDGTAEYRWRLGRSLNGAVWFVLVGVIWLLDVLHILRWGSSWPLLLIACGILLILKRTVYEYAPGYPPPPPGTTGMTVTPPAPTASAVDAAPSEPVHDDEFGHGQEGR